MKYRIDLSPQVKGFVSALPPQSRRECKRGLTALENWQGDIAALEGRLQGYHRLRVGSHRFLLRIREGARIAVLYAGPRSIVYDVLERMIETGDLQNPPA
jgi:mRNA-degrading endonuclease RelE of RelBE toxin-antitoxin system